MLKKGVYHAIVWVSGAMGIAVIGSYWPMAKNIENGDVGVLVGGPVGESFAGLVCSLFDGFIEPAAVKDGEDYGIEGFDDPVIDQYYSVGKSKLV